MNEENTDGMQEVVQTTLNPVSVMADHFEPDVDIEISEEV